MTQQKINAEVHPKFHRMKPLSRLGNKFSLVILSLVLGATALIAMLYEQTQYQNAMQQASSTLENDARLLSDHIYRQLENLRRDIDLISETPPVQGIIRGVQANGVDPVDSSTVDMWLARLGQIFSAVIKKNPEYEQIRFIGIAHRGREIVRVNRHGDGVMLVADDQLQSKEARDYFQATIKLAPNQFYLSDMDLNREFGKITPLHVPTLRIAKPVFDSNGELFGMLVINRTMNSLFARLKQQLPDGVGFYLTNEKGDYLYHPDINKRFGFDTGRRYRLQDDFPSLKSLFNEEQYINEHKLDITSADNTWKVQFLRIAFDPLNEGRYLGLMLTIPHEQIVAFHKSSRVQNILLICALGFVVLLLTVHFSQRITHPLKSLANSARQIASGDYDIQIPDTGSIELEVLADALRHAANDVGQRERALAHLNEELELRVLERTEALRQREKSLLDAQRIASLGGWEWQTEKDRFVWSDQMYRIFGLSPEAFTPSYSALLEYVHADDRAAVMNAVNEHKIGQARFDIEFRLIRSDGAERVVQSEGEFIRNGEGDVVIVRGTALDITERKQAEKRLRLLASVFEHSLEGITITDPHLKILEVNPAFTSITGYSAQEVVGKTPKVLSSGWHDADYYSEMWRSLNDTGHWQGEMIDRRKNGELFTEWLTISTVYDYQGQLINYVGVFYDTTEKKEAEQRIARLAYYDSLTQLANRSLFGDRLEQALRQSRRNNSSVSLMYIDLDRFKTVNDSLGHKAGDLLLKQVAGRLQECVRESDTVARLGGDEFALILENIDQVQASHIAQKLIQRLGRSFSLEGSEAFIGASIGISIYPNDGTDIASLIKHADIAMYRAKERGRNNYQFFLPEMNAGADERLFLENGLRYAIERNELEVYYQPQVRLEDGKIIGVEALLRWHHSVLGAVSPVRFIPIAEESGLINQIGEWVLEQACLQYRAWGDVVDSEFRMAVNLSARQFNSNIVAMVASVLQRSGVDAANLELEITESMVMQDADSSIQLLASLKELGVYLAIDDFGTGYSSLSYLKRFPLDKLKVDRAFVSDLPDNEEDAAIANAVIVLAKSLGLQVIAEGVETLEQILFLHDQGCDEIQGYYCSRPLPADEITPLLRQKKCAVTLDSSLG
ncbi:EAL domain-containing protein [Sedimenticola selenatireducens]|uniref:bifunctional diguanylate cyclase/phosphodiesterase n=1 Tax=Sedimenticola selenatireducens TaxID=191960 RepID=UPI002AAB41CF|nr:EAL domain-containing protein [Sedimenticola selenatireducens]